MVACFESRTAVPPTSASRMRLTFGLKFDGIPPLWVRIRALASVKKSEARIAR